MLCLLAGWAGCTAQRATPPYSRVEAPAAAQARAIAALQAAGHAPNGPLAWAGATSTWQVPGEYRAFFTAATPGAGADLF
ncbi:MAG: hypothetical protein WHX53_14365, partial [Anaerolineae bacterium]